MLNEYKIAITGASGWVGKNLTEALFEKMKCVWSQFKKKHIKFKLSLVAKNLGC